MQPREGAEEWEKRLAELRADLHDLRQAVENAGPALLEAAPAPAAAPGAPDQAGDYDDLDEVADAPEQAPVPEAAASQASGGAPPPQTMQNTLGMWSDLPLAPPDSIFGVVQQFKADTHPNKVDLVVGAYRTDDGKPYLLPSVSVAEERLASQRINKLYGPIDGLPDFTHASAELVLGPRSPALRENRVALCQSLSGTGALATCANFYAQYLPIKTRVYLSRPTWANHKQIFDFFGFQNIVEYRYWDPVSRSLDFEGMIEELRTAPMRSIVVLHLCAHNPTGCDPTLQQWRTIGKVLHSRRMHVVFDSAYQGYATGDLDHDAAPARVFEQELGMEFAITQSYSKNMGLYGERIGCLSYVCLNRASAERIQSQIRSIVRKSYTNPPIYGARIVTMLLTDKGLRQQWGQELKGMSQRICEMRALLRKALEDLKTPGTWNHITQQIGMFSYTGLSPEQCKHLVSKYSVYLLPSGRVSMAGINSKNVGYIARAIDDACRQFPSTPVDTSAEDRVIPNLVEPFRLPSPQGMWSQTPLAVLDPIFSSHEEFVADPDPRKINLVMVAKGVPKLRPVVAEAEMRLAEARLQKEYAPIDGDKTFCEAAVKLVLGINSPALREQRLALCQSIGGTGALSITASFYSRYLPIQTQILFSNPTWHNHVDIFRNMGFSNLQRYRYWDPKRFCFDFDGMCEDIQNAPRRSVVVLQLCAHNPTGVDPTREQWARIGAICKERRHHVVLDNAFQGWGSGDVDNDAWPARYFERDLGMEFAICQSYSKPMGLYNERIGCFIYVCKQQQSALRIQSQAKVIARRLYSNPPLHGARIVAMILGDQTLRRRWKDEVRQSLSNMRRLRESLLEQVIRLGTAQPYPQWWYKLMQLKGMFLYTGLTPPQIDHMKKVHHVYMTQNGRISMTGLLTSDNVTYVAAAIHDAVEKHPFPAAGSATAGSRTRTRRQSKL
eukprot:TRINITY_DN3893_c0_g2_i1.p1 TRINITY_DN3893_c0_g2~~TRINITY_DN3893_c0_g2_i1.p1  ORF type:complete len:975 (+),score=379.00 TRINITY_DN3893_c0_g2_i1:73-2925(+)